MIYSIAVLDICDFEAIGCKMPKGSGVDATINNGAVVASYKKRKRTVIQDNNASTLKVLRLGDARESKMSALKLLLEYESTKDKIKARRELYAIAFGHPASETEEEHVSDAASDDDDSITI